MPSRSLQKITNLKVSYMARICPSNHALEDCFAHVIHLSNVSTLDSRLEGCDFELVLLNLRQDICLCCHMTSLHSGLYKWVFMNIVHG